MELDSRTLAMFLHSGDDTVSIEVVQPDEDDDVQISIWENGRVRFSFYADRLSMRRLARAILEAAE